MKNSMQIFSVILFTTLLIFLNSCEKEESGCTDATACNFDSSATEDDGSCEYESCSGCTDTTACNYNESATVDDGFCQIPIDDILEIIGPIEQTVYGSVGETLEASSLLKNSSCNDIQVRARQLYSGTGITQFCFAGTCYAENTQLALDILNLPSFVTAEGDIDGNGSDDTFKAYFTPEEAGEFQVNYRFYLENDPTTNLEISINYIVS